MPLSQRRHRLLARIASLGHVVIAMWCIVRLVQNSGEPGHYYQFRHGAAGFEYPHHAVGVWSSAIGLEMIATAWLLMMFSFAATAFTLAVAFGVAAIGFGMLAMHAPPYYGMHVVFLAFSTVWLMIMSIVGMFAGRGGAGDEAQRLVAAVRGPDDAL